MIIMASCPMKIVLYGTILLGLSNTVDGVQCMLNKRTPFCVESLDTKNGSYSFDCIGLVDIPMTVTVEAEPKIPGLSLYPEVMVNATGPDEIGRLEMNFIVDAAMALVGNHNIYVTMTAKNYNIYEMEFPIIIKDRTSEDKCWQSDDDDYMMMFV